MWLECRVNCSRIHRYEGAHDIEYSVRISRAGVYTKPAEICRSTFSVASSQVNAQVLNSWKEIGAYLGRGVRTVERYERDLGLPVRRLGGESGRSVVAFPPDLDGWVHSAPLAELRAATQGRMSVTPDVTQAARDASEIARKESQRLRLKCHELREAHHEMLNQLCVNLLGMVQAIKLKPTHVKAVHQNQIEMLTHALSGCGPPLRRKRC